MDTVAIELTLAEECYARGSETGLSKRELAGLKRILGKRSEREIYAAICRLSRVEASGSMEDGIGLLYSLTETQLAELEWTLKSLQGWD